MNSNNGALGSNRFNGWPMPASPIQADDNDGPPSDWISEPVAIDVESVIEAQLQQLQSGLGPIRQAEFTDDLARIMASEVSLTPTGLDNLFRRINEGLVERGYRRDPPTTWRRRINEQRRTMQPGQDVQNQAQAGRFIAMSSQEPLPGQPRLFGIFDAQARRPITNFELAILEEVEVEDDVEPTKVFKCDLRLNDRQATFQISAKDYASDAMLKQALYTAGGSAITLECRAEDLRNAVAQLSPNAARRRTTTNFGWTPDRQAYLVASGQITASGYFPNQADSPVRVDLSDFPQASYLDMQPLAPEDLLKAKKQIVEDLLKLHQRQVTHTLLGLVAVAILRPFGNGAQRFAAWLKGDTGTGKTMLAKLFMAFFGNYPLSDDNRFVSWSWTPNSIERAGYYFKDALYLVDDFKTATAQFNQTVRLLQAYGDGVARGRLKSDAKFNSPRPIRGQLLVTGENLMDSESSSTARTIIVEVPENKSKDFERRGRCIAENSRYRGVTLDFIRWLLATGRTAQFQERVREREAIFYKRLQGQPNDSRIAINFAMLAAAYLEFAEYLGQDAWPNWKEEAQAFVDQDLMAMLSTMQQTVKDQRPIEVFWDLLGQMFSFKRVRLDNFNDGNAPIVGKKENSVSGVIGISPALALAAVQKGLQEQGRPLLALRPNDIAGLLRREGKLVTREGEPLAASGEGEATQNVRLDGAQARVFFVKEEAVGLARQPQAGLWPGMRLGSATPAVSGVAPAVTPKV